MNSEEGEVRRNGEEKTADLSGVLRKRGSFLFSDSFCGRFCDFFHCFSVCRRYIIKEIGKTDVFQTCIGSADAFFVILCVKKFTIYFYDVSCCALQNLIHCFRILSFVATKY